jgi:hypothetical protein
MKHVDYLIITIGDTKLYRITTELKKKGYSVAVISGSIKPDDISILKENKIPYWHIDDLIDKYHDEIISNDDIAERIQDTYDIPSIRTFYYPHIFYRMEYCGYDDFYDMSNNSDNEFFYKKVLDTFQAIECFFRDNSVRFIIQNMGGEILRRSVYHYGKKYNIPNIFIGWTPVPSHYTLLSNEMGQWDELVQQDFSELSMEEIDKAKKFIDDFRLKGTTVSLRKKNTKIFQKFLNYYKHLRERQNLFSALENTLMGGYRNAKYLYNFSNWSEEPNFGEKFFFFPLHYHGEARLTFWDAQCWRQEFIAEFVARSLPQGYKLYVKPHPEWVTSFPLKGLKILSEVSNIRIIPPNISSIPLIRSCAGVITINNTTAYEAILHQKPVISLGTEFYNNCPSVFHTNNMKDLPRIIYLALRQKPDDLILVSFVNSFLKASHPGDFNNLNEENSLMIVNGILEFTNKYFKGSL